jgi:diamine N-acetyltransferase
MGDVGARKRLTNRGIEIKMTLRERLEQLPEDTWKNEMVSIKPILNQDDLIYATYDCQLTEEQKDFVNPSWFEIGRAFLDRDYNYPCIIYSVENKPVGFINLKAWLLDKDAFSWSYYIDKDHQGKGYGKGAAQLAICILKEADPHAMIKLATEEANKKAQVLYASLGFKLLPERDGDDLVFGL